MRKYIYFITLLAALLWVCPVIANASDGGGRQTSRVNITVVMPSGVQDQSAAGSSSDNESFFWPAKPVITPAPVPELFPISVSEYRENGKRLIIKKYELDVFENPAHIPRESFERDGWMYELADITKAETAYADVREHVETVTLNTDTKETPAILGQLAQTLDYESEDGYYGVLTLNVASIKVEQAGTKTSSYTLTATREFPRLSSPDTSNVPKTITDGGKTYTLSKVDWRDGNTVTVDNISLAEYYTAVATYTTTGSKTVVTGYVTTAEYSGTIGRINQGKTVYAAYFLGTEIKPERIPLEIIRDTPVGAALAPTPVPVAGEEENKTPQVTPEPAAETETPVETETPAPVETAAADPEPSEIDSPSAGTSDHEERSALTTIRVIVAVISVLLLMAAGGALYLLNTRNNKKRKDDAHDESETD